MMVEMNFFVRLLHMRLIQLIQLIFLLMTLLPMKNAMKMKQKKLNLEIVESVYLKDEIDKRTEEESSKLKIIK